MTEELLRQKREYAQLLDERIRRLPTTLDRLRADPATLFDLAGRQPDPWQAGILRGSSKRMLLLCSRQAGKSLTAAALAVTTALLQPGSLTLCLAPAERQSKELFRKALDFYQAVGRPVEPEAENKLELELSNRSRIVAVPGSEGTIRSFSGVQLLLIDEAARVPDDLYRAVRPMLAVSGGRLVALSTPFGKRGWFYREWQSGESWERVRITAEQCPRIPADFLAEERRALGSAWYAQEYGCEFSEAGGTPLFPDEWLNHAERLAALYRGRHRQAKAIGIDPAEGGDRTAMAAVDELGLIELVSRQTPDTSVITGEALAFMRRHNVPPEKVVFDRGGGGKEHADRLRAQGYAVQTVAFGESPSLDPRRGRSRLEDRKEIREERYAYVNRRAEMYGTLSLLLDPANERTVPGIKEVLRGWAIPAEYAELRRQLAPIPKLYDGEGRLLLPPKNRRDGAAGGGTGRTLVELIGHSPDEADAVCLAVHGMQHKVRRVMVGSVT